MKVIEDIMREADLEVLRRAPQAQRKYSKITDSLRTRFLTKIFQENKSIKKAAEELNINYSSAKTILTMHRKKSKYEPLLSEADISLVLKNSDASSDFAATAASLVRMLPPKHLVRQSFLSTASSLSENNKDDSYEEPIHFNRPLQHMSRELLQHSSSPQPKTLTQSSPATTAAIVAAPHTTSFEPKPITSTRINQRFQSTPDLTAFTSAPTGIQSNPLSQQQKIPSLDDLLFPGLLNSGLPQMNNATFPQTMLLQLQQQLQNQQQQQQQQQQLQNTLNQLILIQNAMLAQNVTATSTPLIQPPLTQMLLQQQQLLNLSNPTQSLFAPQTSQATTGLSNWM